jgi:uncharacterized protein (DUF58 family)
MLQSGTLDGGREVHHNSLAGADVAPDHAAAIVSLGNSETRPCDIAPRIRRRSSTSPPRVWVYAAGPWGDWRSRDRARQGQVYAVVAPAVIPQTSGHRGNTTRRDASQLDRLLRAGDLPPVDLPPR